MNSGIGLSELCLLLILALVFLTPEQMKEVLLLFRKWKGKFYRLKYDLEDSIEGTMKEKPVTKNVVEKDKESAWILKELETYAPLESASTVAAFYPLPNEPNIIPLLEKLAKENRLLLPRTQDQGIMDFVQIKDLEKDLITGHFHIHEPKPELPIWEGEIPLFLVPGVQFSRDGGRIGHGKGFYDRFLKKHPQAIKCGIAFSSQIAETDLKLKPHDVPMNYIVAPHVDAPKETP